MAHIISSEPPRQVWGASATIEDRYRPLIVRLEAMAARDPAGYRRRVILAAYLGYAYIALVVLGILAVMAAAVLLMIFGRHFLLLALKPLIFLLLGIAYIFRSLKVKMEAPPGIAITRGQAPRLFATLDQVRDRLNGPKLDRVCITDDFNASIVQRPRFGGLGGHRNMLSLGLPLLAALDEDEVRAVIAHEYGHLAGAHGKMTAWIYRVRMSWLQLSLSLGDSAIGHLFAHFFRWYGPWFSAYSFVLARGNEYQADRAAADIAGPAVAARALTRTAVSAHRYNGFWETLFETAGHQSQVTPHGLMSAHLVRPMTQDDMRAVLATALSEQTDIHDTHPCLTDRLAAMNEELPHLEPVAFPAAGVLLGDELAQSLTCRLDADWWARVGAHWTERHEQAQARRREQARLAAEAATGDLSPEDSWTYQDLLEEDGKLAEALVIARARAAVAPDDAALTALGRLQLETGDGEGMDVLARVIAGRPPLSLKLTALFHSVAWLRQNAPEDLRLSDYEGRFESARLLYHQVQDELGRLREGCPLEPAEAPESLITALRSRTARSGDVRGLWLARRRLRADPDIWQYILLYDRGQPDDTETDPFGQDLLDIAGKDANAFVIRLNPSSQWLKNAMVKLGHTRLVRR